MQLNIFHSVLIVCDKLFFVSGTLYVVKINQNLFIFTRERKQQLSIANTFFDEWWQNMDDTNPNMECIMYAMQQNNNKKENAMPILYLAHK